MEIINEAIRCQDCKNILDSPVILPCGKSICKIHVLEKVKIFCNNCEDNHLIPNGGFFSNKDLEKIIKTKIHKCDLGDEYKNAFNSCKKLAEILEEIDLLKRDPDFYIYEKIGDLKRDIDLKKAELIVKINEESIDLKRDELILKINEDADKFINQLNEYEVECKDNVKSEAFLVKSNKLEAKTNEIRQKLNEWSNDLRILESNEIKWKGVNKELEKIIKDLRLRSKKLKEDLLLNLIVSIGKSEYFIQMSFLFLPDFLIDSKIVGRNLKRDLFDLCEFPYSQKWTLLYRASKHGFLPSDFHAKCDNKPNTLTIIKSNCDGIFGGYTDQSWDSISEYKSDPNAFLFSLVNVHEHPAKIKIFSNCDKAIYCNSDRGPCFGNEELQVSWVGNERRGYSDLRSCFKYEHYPRGSNGSNFVAGYKFFDLIEVEVFMKN